MKKIKIYLCFSLLALASMVSAQTKIYLTGTVNKTIRTETAKIEPGSKIELVNVFTNSGSSFIDCKANTHSFFIPINDISKITLDNPKDQDALWSQIQLTSVSYKGFLTRVIRYDLRKEQEDDAMEFIRKIDNYSGFFVDQYIDDYLHSLLYKIHSITLNDKRPGNLFVKVLNLNEPNYYSLPNGTIIITTGLLSMLNSEDELIGVLSHEVAHFVLDHQIDNILKDIQRQKKAEFWAGLATVVAAAGESYMNVKNNYYTGGSLTMSAAILSSAIANSVTARMGLKYSQSQEFEADQAAKKVMAFLNRDTLALSSVLVKMEDYFVKTGNYFALSGEGSHPSLYARITALGAPTSPPKVDKGFTRIMSTIITETAIQEFNYQHLLVCSELIDRNIENACAAEDDYILKGLTLRKLYDNIDSNQLVMTYLMKAKGLNVTPRIQIDKEIGLTFIRLKKIEDASKSFAEYKTNLLKTIVNEDNKKYVNDEIEWASLMIHKCNVL